jgi:GTP-binding protein
VANKADNPRATDFYEFYALGIGDPIPVSATSGKQTGDLLDVIVSQMPEESFEESTALRVAVIGRPNVGKSSFVNRLVGEDRVVVSEESGTTRDAIDTPMRFRGRDLILVDTAGLRRQSKVSDGIEFYSTLRTRRAIDRADICCLLIDAATGIEGQDMKIANLAWESGRALIIVVNKWDLVEKDDKSSAKFEKENREKAPFLKHVPFLFTSALTGQRVTRILDLLMTVDAERQKRISTARVNETLGELVQRRQPPQAAGREIRLLYATQVEVAPPTFAVFSNYPDLLEEHYIRYLHNGFRAAWQFTGNPVRILLRRRAA